MKKFTPITEPIAADFFTIFTQDGKRFIHLHGYTYESDEYWANMEASGIVVPLNEFIENIKTYSDGNGYVDTLYEGASQYQGDYDEAGIVKVINHYYRDVVFSIPRDAVGNPDAWLSFNEITDETPDGSYIC